MNSLLLKNRPKDVDEVKFKEMWENQSYSLEALYKTIKEMVPDIKVKADDFTNPNHYAKMVWESGQRDFASRILDLFPNSLKTS